MDFPIHLSFMDKQIRNQEPRHCKEYVKPHVAPTAVTHKKRNGLK